MRMASRAALAALALLLLVGCAKPMRDDLYVLMPDKDGKTGALSVESGGQQAVLDQPYASARVTEPGRVAAGAITEQEARQAFGAALDAQPARPTSSSSISSRPGRAGPGLPAAPRPHLRRDRPAARAGDRVIGHTDRVGAVPYNDALSLRRAERVRDELMKLGIAAEDPVAGRGEREPLVPTADEVAEPRNRRVEINVR